MKYRKLLYFAAIIILIILLISKCNCSSKSTVQSTDESVSFVKPPISTVDVPYTDYSVDASKGDTVVYRSGSIILFPPNAFVDENGKPIEGNVQVKYREFADPVDFFLSGIPMDYDSGGVHYNFESAGMCDIRAFKDGEPVYVNKAAKPEINIATQNSDLAQNLYYLDTVSKKWINRGKSLILNVGETDVAVEKPEVAVITEPVI